jgi:hypothetical protein
MAKENENEVEIPEIRIELTEQELREAVACYDLLEEAEVEAACKVIAQVDEVGVRSAQAMEEAFKQVQATGQGDAFTVMAAGIVPALLIGYLAGKSSPRTGGDQL